MIGKPLGHLHRHCAEFDLRYNTRELDDMARAGVVAQGIAGKRLTYQRTGAGEASY